MQGTKTRLSALWPSTALIVWLASKWLSPVRSAQKDLTPEGAKAKSELMSAAGA